MKKLLTYLALLIFFQAFISATPSLCSNHSKVTPVTDSNTSCNKKALQDDIDKGISTINILTIRYF